MKYSNLWVHWCYTSTYLLLQSRRITWVVQYGMSWPTSWLHLVCQECRASHTRYLLNTPLRALSMCRACLFGIVRYTVLPFSSDQLKSSKQIHIAIYQATAKNIIYHGPSWTIMLGSVFFTIYCCMAPWVLPFVVCGRCWSTMVNFVNVTCIHTGARDYQQKVRLSSQTWQNCHLISPMRWSPNYRLYSSWNSIVCCEFHF